MTAPIIGVTGPDRGGAAGWLLTSFGIRIAGGTPVRLTPSTTKETQTFDGLILGGGADVDPALYGQERFERTISQDASSETESTAESILSFLMLPIMWGARKLSEVSVNSRMDVARDKLEFRLLKEAVSKSIPVLGICRGEQLLNVFFGGTLHQKLETFYVEEPEVRSFLPRKTIRLVENTRLHKILGFSSCKVNGLHLQGVDKVGSELVASAFDSNGIVQAVEHVELPFVIGVQWHPEYLPQLSEQRALFKEFISACVKRRFERQTDSFSKVA